MHGKFLGVADDFRSSWEATDNKDNLQGNRPELNL